MSRWRATVWTWATLGLASALGAPPRARADDAPAPPLRPADIVELQDLPGVVVTGTPFVRRTRDGPLALPRVELGAIGSRDVFDPRRVRETGATAVNDLVQHLPALSTRPYNGGEAAAPSFSMRGLPDDGLTEYVHVLIDGVPASPLPYGWTAFSFLPITTDRVHALDYLRGAHTVRYSPNTVGGVLNFVTAPIPDCPTLRARATVGTNAYRSFLLQAGGTSGPWGWLVTAVDRRGDGYRRGGGFEQQDAQVKLRRDLGGGNCFAAAVSVMQSDHRAPGGLTQAEFFADRLGNARPANGFEGDRVVADTVLHLDRGRDAWIEGFAYASHTSRHLRAQRPHFGAPTTLSDWRDESWFVGSGARFEWPLHIAGCRHTLHGGVRHLREWIPHWKLHTEPFPAGPGVLTQDARYETDTVSVHLDDTFEPAPRLTVQVGARLEWVPTTTGRDRVALWNFDDDFVRVLPGAGASYRISPCAAVFANYFEGFRAPQVWGYNTAVANRALTFELGRSAEVGLRWEELQGFEGSVTAWRTEYDDFGVFYTGSYENLGRIEAVGVDIAARWDLEQLRTQLAGFSVDGSATFQDSELQSGPNAGKRTPYAWQRKAAWRLRYERRGWHASVGGTYTGGSFSDEPNTLAPSADGRLGWNPEVALWDARVAREQRVGRRGHIEAAVGVTNLLDREWYVHSRGGFFGGGLVAGPPRQLYASLEFTWDL